MDDTRTNGGFRPEAGKRSLRAGGEKNKEIGQAKYCEVNEYLDEIRDRLLRWVRQHEPRSHNEACEESILLRDGRLAGTRFTIGPVTATWWVGDSTVEIRSPHGSDTLVLSHARRSDNQAA